MEPFSKKQMEFIQRSTAKWNLAHGAVRTGKTVGTLFRFMQAVNDCRDSNIWMIGYTSDTIYQNAIRLIMESDQLSLYRPFCAWFPGDRVLKFKNKVIKTCGMENSGSVGKIQGQTFSLVYCDEMTLFPESSLDMIDTRLSNKWSMGFGAMNPSHPKHKIKQWIDQGLAGDKNYYSQHYTLDDNPYVDDDYKLRIKHSLSGLFYKRNYLGLWVLAEGAIFDFFDDKLHVVDRPPRAAEYWVAGIDYGTSNSFACLLMGVSTGKYDGIGKRMWIEKEYYWDSHVMGRQKTNSEYADDVQRFIEPYGPKAIYCDPSAAAFKLELQRRQIRVVDANNDVTYGIDVMTNEMAVGNLTVCSECKNLIREIQTYVWDPKQSEKGIDAPLKRDDHACDALRYILATHKIQTFNDREHYKKQEDQLRQRMHPGGYGFR